MAKKSKRSRKRSQVPKLSPAQMVKPGEGHTSAASGAVSQPRREKSLREEYQYVVTDLKRIAIIAATMAVVMLVVAVLLI